MTSHAPVTAKRQFDLVKTYKPIEAEMQSTTETLRDALRHVDPLMDEYLDYAFRLGGKRLRPALMLLCAKAWGLADQRAIYCAAALEMIHTGSLVHDDILDGARFRRKLETINVKWDSHRAVLIGDILITRALKLICQCDDIDVFREFSVRCLETVEGELFQTDSIGNFELTVDDYRRIVGGKTAALLECATRLGGRLAGARDAYLDAFARFGRNIGIAFQIVDDILDLVGSEEATGKTLGSDLSNKKETLPVIYYLESCGEKEARAFLERVERGIAPEEREEIAALLKESGAVTKAMDEANRLIDEALADLNMLRDRAQSNGRDSASLSAFDSLEDVARFVVGRDR